VAEGKERGGDFYPSAAVTNEQRTLYAAEQATS